MTGGMTDGFRYRADDHSYWLDERRLPSVTQILSVLPNAYETVPPEVLERKRILGTAVHRACELDDQEVLDQFTVHPLVEPYLTAWRRFCADTGFTPSAIEEPGYSREYGYAGTLDRVGEIGGALAVLDLKCVAELKPETALQTAGYAQIALDHWGHEVKRRYAVQLRPDAQYRLQEYTDRADRRVFLACLQIYQWRAGRG